MKFCLGRIGLLSFSRGLGPTAVGYATQLLPAAPKQGRQKGSLAWAVPFAFHFISDANAQGAQGQEANVQIRIKSRTSQARDPCFGGAGKRATGEARVARLRAKVPSLLSCSSCCSSLL